MQPPPTPTPLPGCFKKTTPKIQWYTILERLKTRYWWKIQYIHSHLKPLFSSFITNTIWAFPWHRENSLLCKTAPTHAETSGMLWAFFFTLERLLNAQMTDTNTPWRCYLWPFILSFKVIREGRGDSLFDLLGALVQSLSWLFIHFHLAPERIPLL